MAFAGYELEISESSGKQLFLNPQSIQTAGEHKTFARQSRLKSK